MRECVRIRSKCTSQPPPSGQYIYLFQYLCSCAHASPSNAHQCVSVNITNAPRHMWLHVCMSAVIYGKKAAYISATPSVPVCPCQIWLVMNFKCHIICILHYMRTRSRLCLPIACVHVFMTMCVCVCVAVLVSVWSLRKQVSGERTHACCIRTSSYISVACFWCIPFPPVTLRLPSRLWWSDGQPNPFNHTFRSYVYVG